MTHPDDCPNPSCDGRIERAGEARDAGQEQGICPKCGTRVQRATDAPWMEASGPGSDAS